MRKSLYKLLIEDLEGEFIPGTSNAAKKPKPSSSPKKLQGSTSNLEKALAGIGVEGKELKDVKTALMNYKRTGSVQKLNMSDRKAMAEVFAKMIDTSDDAKLGVVFSALKNLESK